MRTIGTIHSPAGRASPRPLAATMLALALLVAGASSAGGARAAEMTVKIENFTFEPQMLTVPAGTTVTWVNDDDIPHLVAEKEGKFRSKALDTGDKYSQVFPMPGTVEYFCALHPNMTGKIVMTR